MTLSEYRKRYRYASLTKMLSIPITAENRCTHPAQVYSYIGEPPPRSPLKTMASIIRYTKREAKFFATRPELEQMYKSSKEAIDKLCYMYSTDPVYFRTQIEEIHAAGISVYADLLHPLEVGWREAGHAKRCWHEITGVDYKFSHHDAARIKLDKWVCSQRWMVCRERGVLMLPTSDRVRLMTYMKAHIEKEHDRFTFAR